MNREYKYNSNLPFIKKDIQGNLCIDEEFVFNTEKDRLPYTRLIKWMTSSNPQRSEKRNDRFTPEVIYNSDFLNSKKDILVWLGHSSFFAQIDGKRILTDPVFHDLTPFLRRKHQLPCAIHEFESIDYILLSHGHRDHFDVPTLKKLRRKNPNVEILCPLGFESMLQSIGFNNIQEAAWWQEFKTKDLSITFLPAKHWNRRLLTDYNRTLWGSFSIIGKEHSIYFAGDTGMSTHFKEINTHFSQFDICLMPVGAYKPRYVMEWAHISPEEAIQGFHELNGKIFIPMHYGTFDLSDEPASEPIRLLEQFKKEEIIKGDLRILKVGEQFSLHRN